MHHSTIIDLKELLALAKKRGMTQEELCKKAGLNRCIISRIRTGKSKAKLSTISKLIEAARS